jgi:hypothetical protein
MFTKYQKCKVASATDFCRSAQYCQFCQYASMPVPIPNPQSPITGPQSPVPNPYRIHHQSLTTHFPLYTYLC